MQPDPLNRRSRDSLLLLFSALGILGLTGRGIYLGVTALLPLNSASRTDLASSLLGAFSMVFCAALLVPLLLLCVRRLKGQEIPRLEIAPMRFRHLAELIGVWLVVLILGTVLNTISPYGAAIASPFFILGIALPIAGLVWVATGGLPLGSRRRAWSAFGIGLAGSTVGALILESLVAGAAILVAMMATLFIPGLRSIVTQVWNQVNSGMDMQSLLVSLAPTLNNPLVLLLALLFASILAPLIEETLKPAAVWLLGKRLQSPAQGFALGALCGAGFSMLEGMQAAGGMSQMLGIGIAARATSSLMHITASAILGWGIASARLEGRYGRLALAYLLSVGIHGLWNGSVVLTVFGALRMSVQGGTMDLPGILMISAGIVVLGAMLLGILILLPFVNRRLRPAPQPAEPPAQSDIIAPL